MKISSGRVDELRVVLTGVARTRIKMVLDISFPSSSMQSSLHLSLIITILPLPCNTFCFHFFNCIRIVCQNLQVFFGAWIFFFVPLVFWTGQIGYVATPYIVKPHFIRMSSEIDIIFARVLHYMRLINSFS